MPIQQPVDTSDPLRMTPPGQPQTPDFPPESEGLKTQVRPDYSQSWDAQVEINALNSLVGIPFYGAGRGLRAIQEYRDSVAAENRNDRKMSPDEIKTKYGIDVSEPMYEVVAASRAKTKHELEYLNAWRDWGEPLGLRGGITSGLMTGLDPANLLLGVAIGGAGLAAKIAGNVAGNLIADIPTYALGKREGTEERTLGQVASESALGGIGGTLAIEGLGQGLKYAGKGLVMSGRLGAKMVKKMTPETLRKAMNAAIKQKEAGVKVDLSPVTKVETAKADGTSAQGTTDYAFTPVEHPSHEGQFEAVRAGDLESTGYDTELGSGRKFSSDPNRARNMAHNTDDGSAGEVRTNHIAKDAKILNWMKDLQDPEVKAYVDALSARLGRDITKDLEGAERLADVMPETREEMDIANEVAREQGYHGATTIETSPNGTKHNVTNVWDESKIEQIEARPTDDAEVPTITKDAVDAEAERLQDPTARESYDFGAHEIIKAYSAKDFEDQTYLEEITKAQEATAKQILSTENLSPEVKEMTTKAEETFRSDIEIKAAKKILAQCLTGKRT